MLNHLNAKLELIKKIMKHLPVRILMQGLSVQNQFCQVNIFNFASKKTIKIWSKMPISIISPKKQIKVSATKI